MSAPDFTNVPTITGHKATREVLRDTEKYSSDLQGDADVRDYRQIPLEVDPPRHHLFRAALAPYFVKSAIEKFIPEFRKNSEDLLASYFNHESGDVVSTLALPLVMRNLGVILNRPQDVDEWISWGPDVWTAESEQRDGAVLHRYIDQIYKEALKNESDDMWSTVARLEIEGKRVSPLEFKGIVGVLLAGGRDTVVKLLTGMLWHFGNTDDLEKIRSGEVEPNVAIQEMLRFLSPLPLMFRTTVPESTSEELPPDRYVGVSFISANFDETVFENPFAIDFQRGRIPHLSFGFGPHTCIGNHVAEIEAKVFLEVLRDSGLSWKIAQENIRFHKAPYNVVPEQFVSLTLARSSR